MTQENPITSEKYADIVVEYQGDLSLLKPFENNPINIINSVIAMAHMPLQDFEKNGLLNLEYARMPSLGGLVSDSSIEASGVKRLRSIPGFNLRGQGVLVAIIDTGVDYTNPVFQNADNTTRIITIWDQTIPSEINQKNVKYGTVYTREQINLALQSKEPFLIVPSKDVNGHGTMVAGIAGGTENPEKGFYGVAPEVEFIVVKMKEAKKYLRKYYFIPDNVVCSQETDYIFALEYVLQVAENMQKPIVVCVSTNASEGAHDGRSVTGRYLSSVASRPGVAVVIAGGNEGNTRRHFFGTVKKKGEFEAVELHVGENEKGFVMELWGQSPSILSVDILTPSGEFVPRISSFYRESRVISFIFDPTIIYFEYYIVESESGDQLIMLRFANPSPGIWRLRVYQMVDIESTFHIWLPFDAFVSEDTYFIKSDPYTTILGVGNAQIPITVTAYNDAGDNLYLNSSRGYTRTGNIKPNLAAPGVNITGPTLEHGFAQFTGTSIAAAHTSGIAAMILEWGIVKGRLIGMSSVEINKLLMRGARREAGIEYPNRDWGYGILDVYNVFDSLRSGMV